MKTEQQIRDELKRYENLFIEQAIMDSKIEDYNIKTFEHIQKITILRWVLNEWV